jgi:hypothetical protein
VRKEHRPSSAITDSKPIILPAVYILGHKKKKKKVRMHVQNLQQAALQLA